MKPIFSIDMKKITGALLFVILLPLEPIASDEIVFSETINGKSSVFSLNIDGSDLREIAKDATHPQWSPDGKMIAFIRSSQNGGTNLEISDENGNILHNLKSGVDQKQKKHICSVKWSQNSKSIAYTSAFFESRALYLEVYDLEGKKLRVFYDLPFDDLDEACLSDIQWTEAGNKIILPPQLAPEGKGIYMYGIDSGKSEILTNKGHSPRFWNDDQLIYITRDNSIFTVLGINTLDKKKRIVFQRDDLISTAKPLALSSKIVSGKIIATAWWTNKQAIYVIDLKAENSTEVNIDDYMVFFPELYQEGDKIIFLGINKADKSEHPDNNLGIYLYDLKSRKTQFLTKYQSEMDEYFSWNFLSGNNEYFNLKMNH